ncbi:protein YIPF1 homolog isoform X2 [Manihot esculenta]|uniref:protein YIPF1 homolog isoform X2 n=1 Tax=Manihot esculenta TaxID=3983 RepID=UPI000B5D7559|nr:protein YIPF1 homolog isoform X2 [Manihot esculenta]
MMSGNYTSIDNQKVSGSVPSVPDPGHISAKFSDSNLQNFPPPSAHGKISSGSRLPRDADDTFSKPVSGTDEPQQSGWMRTFTIAAYKPYFDVDTIDVLERIKDSLFPFRGTFTEKTAGNPDLYGPFWICTTLIFVAASIGTFVTYLAHKLKNKEWDYDINVVTWSAGVFYGYVTIVPLGLYVVLKYFSVPSGLVQLFCLYGYSLFIFIPALCLSIIPLEIFRWVIAGVAGFMSASFVALNLRAHIMSAGERARKETTLISIREQEGWREEEGERSVRAEERESALVTFEEEDLSRAFLFTFFYWFPFRFVFWNLY